MADVFKQLLEGRKNRSQKTVDKKTRSFLNKEESDYYSKNKMDMDDDFDIDLGVEKDAANHLQDIEKISFRELDKKPEKDQLRILKTEYQRVYDKANHLNNMFISSEKTISNFMIDKRQDERFNKEIRRFIRTMVSILPGNSELKTMVEKGAWQPKEIEPLLEEALQRVVDRIKAVDDTVAFETQELRNENLGLKEKILVYRNALRKVDAIEEMLKQNTQNGINPGTENPFPSNEDYEGSEFEMESELELKLESIDKSHKEVEPEAETETEGSDHKPHFGDFYEEFKTSYETLKKEDSITPKPVKTKEKEAPTAKKEVPVTKAQPTPPKPEPLSLNIDKKHPLSPDFVETEKESIMELFDDNISDYINNLSPNQEFVLSIIGKTGISRNPDLRDFLTEHEEGKQIYVKGKRFDYQSLSNDVANLRDKGILLDDKISLGGNGGSSNMIVYELSNVGKQCFKMLFKDDPVIAEKRRIREHHASVEHGYLIKDSAKIFRELGMTVHTDLSRVTFKVDNKKRKVFDFLAEDKEGKTMHIEVERGTHTKEDFFDACDKIYQVTKDFYFITPNETVMNKKTKQMFFLWVTERLGGIQKADVVLHITTIDTLRKKPKNIWSTTDLRNAGQ